MNETPHGLRRARMALAWALASGACLALDCAAAELTVKVTGITAPYGSVGCSLYAAAPGFPMDNARARAEWVAASGDTVSCTFKDVAAGRYAVSVAHDTNGNRTLDTNVFGIPTEQWGVSNNVRPSLRAPRFDEAAFSVSGDAAALNLDIKVAK